ncbi:hypothetical protein CYMTET_33462, partial [Cymbomonas tetramitiformis]
AGPASAVADVDIAQVQSSARTEVTAIRSSSSYGEDKKKDLNSTYPHSQLLSRLAPSLCRTTVPLNGSGLTGVWLQASSDPYAAIFIMTAMPELLNSYYTVVAMVLEHDYYHPVAEQQIVTVLTNILDEQSYPLRPDSKAPVQPLQVNCSLFVANCTEDAMAHDGVYVVLESVVVTQAPSQYGGWFYVMDDTGIAAVGSDMGYDAADLARVKHSFGRHPARRVEPWEFDLVDGKFPACKEEQCGLEELPERAGVRTRHLYAYIDLALKELADMQQALASVPGIAQPAFDEEWAAAAAKSKKRRAVKQHVESDGEDSESEERKRAAAKARFGSLRTATDEELR